MVRRLFPFMSTLFMVFGSMTVVPAQSLPGFDFTKQNTANGWHADHDVTSMTWTPEGLKIEISGEDPYISGPARNYPANTPLWLHIKLKSKIGGGGQIFYFTAAQGPNEANSVHFSVQPNRWEDIHVPMPSLGLGTILRFDPPGTEGECILRSIAFESRLSLKEPVWPVPPVPKLTRTAISVKSGNVELRHNPSVFGMFEVLVNGKPMAVGNSRPLIGYTVKRGELHWLDLAKTGKTSVLKSGRSFTMRIKARDRDGAVWTIAQTFGPGKSPNCIATSTKVAVSANRVVAYLPFIMIHPGLGSFGARHNHALFAGIEYMDKQDTSSSEADIIGPGSKRQVPDNEKITFPLMAIQINNLYVGMVWEMEPNLSAVFDSPDRLFHSGGNVMGLVYPGSDGLNRVEGSLLPYRGATIKANSVVSVAATIIGGSGESVVPAVKQYVAIKGLPPLPQTGMDKQAYVSFAAHGWLDSKIHEGPLYRHAYWPGSSFAPHPASDPALFMEWLATVTKDPDLAARLRRSEPEILAQVGLADYDNAGVSHVRFPAVSLVFGDPEKSAVQAARNAEGLTHRFEPDGTIPFRKSPDGLDYGKTHFAPDANGLTPQVVQSLLENAVFSGDRNLMDEGLRFLKALDKFDNTAPRGAQTWEVPLHTPDIMASAYMARAYTLGYEITGDKSMLDRAVYWAWTGVPFVYLVKPTPYPVGLYATIPVFGATQWQWNWLGLPVQWCGLVYSDALYWLILLDPSGPWKMIADGIVDSGIQQSFPAEQPDMQGLLPDSYNLKARIRNGVAINPGTLQANAWRMFGGPEMFDYRIFRSAGVIVHAPGAIRDIRESANKVSFIVNGWPKSEYGVLISGLKSSSSVAVNGGKVDLADPAFNAAAGRLTVKATGKAAIEIVP